MTFTLGTPVEQMTVYLPRNGDFYATLKNATGDWDPATVITLKFSNGTTWTATIVGDEAQFAQDKAAVNTLIAASPVQATLYYTLGSVELPWGYGSVNVQA